MFETLCEWCQRGQVGYLAFNSFFWARVPFNLISCNGLTLFCLFFIVCFHFLMSYSLILNWKKLLLWNSRLSKRIRVNPMGGWDTQGFQVHWLCVYWHRVTKGTNRFTKSSNLLESTGGEGVFKCVLYR